MPPFLIFVAAMAAGPAAAAEAPQPADAAEAPKTADKGEVDPKSEIKCKRQSVTGSRVKRVKVCKTIAQWESDEELNRSSAKDTIDRGSTWGVGSPGS